MNYKRRALSEIISTTILVAAMLIVVIGVMGFAIDLFNTQTQDAEFSQAQNGVIALAQGIDSILPTQGAAAFSTFNSRTGGPVIINNFDQMVLTVLNPQGKVAFSNSININEFRYRAGSLVSQEGEQWVRAGNFTGQPFSQTFNGTLIIQNNSAPLGFVYTSHDNGATWVTMDYRRINVNNLGVFNISLGAVPVGKDQAENEIYKQVYQLVDIVQINLVNITGGTFSGSSNLVVSAVNQGTSTATLSFPDPSPGGSGSYSFKIAVSLNKQSLGAGLPTVFPFSSLTVSVPDTVSGFPVNTVVEIFATNIQLSIGGG
jgi:hypothetical protein